MTDDCECPYDFNETYFFLNKYFFLLMRIILYGSVSDRDAQTKKNCEADGQSGKQRQRQNKVRTHIYIYLNEFSRMFRIKFN